MVHETNGGERNSSLEFETLREAVSVHPDRTARLETCLQQEISWDCLVGLAEAQKVVPRFYEGLKHAEPGLVPPWVMQRLRVYALGNMTRCLWLVQELTGILQALEAQGIPAMPFKGPALAAAVYGSVAGRHAGDLDILVREDDVARACEVVMARGYAPPDQLADETRPYLRNDCFLESAATLREYQLIRPDNMVEIHWQFTPRYFPFTMITPELWQRMQMTSLGSLSVRALPPEDLLLMLCVHGGKHAWARLNWVCDVAQTLHEWPDIEWPRVKQQAADLGCCRMLFVGVLLAHQLLGAIIPEDILHSACQDTVAVRLVQEVSGRLSRGADLSESEEKRFTFQVRERLRDRVLYLSHLLMTPTQEDWGWIPLPQRLTPLYRLLRPARLMGQAIQSKFARPQAQEKTA